jgi:hypothetical protein
MLYDLGSRGGGQPPRLACRDGATPPDRPSGHLMVPTITTILPRFTGVWATRRPPDALLARGREIGSTAWRARVRTPVTTRPLCLGPMRHGHTACRQRPHRSGLRAGQRPTVKPAPDARGASWTAAGRTSAARGREPPGTTAGGRALARVGSRAREAPGPRRRPGRPSAANRRSRGRGAAAPAPGSWDGARRAPVCSGRGLPCRRPGRALPPARAGRDRSRAAEDHQAHGCAARQHRARRAERRDGARPRRPPGPPGHGPIRPTATPRRGADPRCGGAAVARRPQHRRAVSGRDRHPHPLASGGTARPEAATEELPIHDHIPAGTASAVGPARAQRFTSCHSRKSLKYIEAQTSESFRAGEMQLTSNRCRNFVRKAERRSHTIETFPMHEANAALDHTRQRHDVLPFRARCVSCAL